MNIQTAFKLTGTTSKPELARFLGFNTSSAVYQWSEEEIPTTSEVEILKRTGHYPTLESA